MGGGEEFMDNVGGNKKVNCQNRKQRAPHFYSDSDE
jgi:hypothetical protein